MTLVRGIPANLRRIVTEIMICEDDMSTYNELLNCGRLILKEGKVADANVDAWYLLAHVFGINRTDFLLHGEEEAPLPLCRTYLELVKKRSEHIPLQHLTGVQDFMGLEFEVNEHVLIPRQDTECLVEEVLKVCEGKSVLDMCSGSGCIIISLAKLGKLKAATAVDLSEEALRVAVKNADRHRVVVEWIQSDLFDNVKETYDIIVSNPPYIPTEDIRELMPEVREHEPYMALDGAEDGLKFYRRISASLKDYLNPGGYVFYEIGYNQGNAVRNILLAAGMSNITIKKDLRGHDRVVSARFIDDL